LPETPDNPELPELPELPEIPGDHPQNNYTAEPKI